MLEQGIHKRKRLAIEVALPLELSVPVRLQIESFATNDDLVSSPTLTHPVRPPSIPKTLPPLMSAPTSSPPPIPVPVLPPVVSQASSLPPNRTSALPPSLPAQPSSKASPVSVPSSPVRTPKFGVWVLVALGLVGLVVAIKSCGESVPSPSSAGGNSSAVAVDTAAVTPTATSHSATDSQVVSDTAPAAKHEVANMSSTSLHSITDPRDGKTYGTVRIGHQLWMAKNLDHSSDNSWCYDNDASNCAKYGRLYDWETAKRACPEGWHVPSDEEWMTLERELGMSERDMKRDGYRGTHGEGRILKSQYEWHSGNSGTDDFGFSVLPAGAYGKYGKDVRFGGIGNSTCFWSSSQRKGNTGWGRCFNGNRTEISRGFLSNELAFSIRCIKG